ncbi:hypothetical protein JVT61DRAFT_8970 [Boletus reticuloceps]|uniref:Uncharacterized protein n=1 Tax=Boletus reticuloceps TaxID=495285 RepID=A0A8I3A5K9_9AGAM|nr:hypothetical protein JVT61DRAFT_8970 [Boletus reticuloceps]
MMSATWLTLVPLAAPKYNTFFPGAMKISSIPPNTPAGQLTPKRIPHPILYLGPLHRTLDRNPLLSIYALPRNEVFRDQQVILAFGDKYPWVSVGLEDDFGAAACTTPAAPSCSTCTSTATTAVTASTSAARLETTATNAATYIAGQIQDMEKRTLRDAPRPPPRPPPLGAPRPPPPRPPNPPRLPDAPVTRVVFRIKTSQKRNTYRMPFSHPRKAGLNLDLGLVNLEINEFASHEA